MDQRQLTRMQRKLKKALNQGRIDEVGRQIGFILRERVVTSYSLALSLLCALSVLPVRSLADLHRAFVALTGKDIEYKPFHDQLSKEAFPELMREVLCLLIEHLVVDALRPIPGHLLARVEHRDRLPADDLQARLLRRGAGHASLVEVAIDLGAAAPHRQALAGVEVLELDRGRVGGQRHRPAERVDLPNEVALGLAADGRVARHATDRAGHQRHQDGRHPEPRRGQRGLDPGVPTSDDDDPAFHVEPPSRKVSCLFRGTPGGYPATLGS